MLTKGLNAPSANCAVLIAVRTVNCRNQERGKQMSRQLKGANVLLVGGSGGIGTELAKELIKNGVASIVVASKSPIDITQTNSMVVKEQVDVTNFESVQKFAEKMQGRDISIVINCSGVNSNSRLIEERSMLNARQEMEVNYFGLLNLASAMGPMLTARGGGVFMQVLSFLSHVNLPVMATYSASKAAAHSLTQALRAEWRGQGITVCGVYPTAVDTVMSRDQQGPKLSPAILAFEMVEALKHDVEDLYPGDAAIAYGEYQRNPKALESAMAESINH